MRYKRLDLNLLVALDVLLNERSITRAAERLHLSQSATSNALARLREYFDDQLLVQVGRRLDLTPRAEGLIEGVRDLLIRIDGTIGGEAEFVPSQSERTFTVFASDYTQTVLMPHLLALASAQRCSAHFEFLPLLLNPRRALERAEADMLVMPHDFLSPDHPQEVLFRESFVCVVWNGSALAREELSLQRYLDGQHVVMRPPGTSQDSFESWFLKRYGMTRKVAVRTYAFAPMISLVVGTDYIATMHERLARRLAAAWPVTILPTPVPMAQMEQVAQWHEFRSRDPGIVWLRDLLREAVSRMDAELGVTPPG